MKKIIFTGIIILSGLWQLAAQTGFSGESGIITMDTKNPVVTLQAPNGGGSFNYTLPLNITWSATDDSFGAAPISAGLSTEEGGTVNWLSTGLANSGTTQLDPPDVATLFAKAHIKAIDAFGNEAVDLSDGYFELKVPGEITNVTAAQRTDGSDLVDVSYDLTGSEPQYAIALEVSLDDGINYQPATHVSGNVGVAVPGDNRQIIWDLGAKFPDGIFNVNMKVRVIADEFEWACGLPFIDFRDGQKYETTQIGTQCWMGENLNIGTRINGATNQSNNGIIEKYCFGDTESNCFYYGGQYQWDEAMQYSANEGVQGICPQDWHLPSDAEWVLQTDFVVSQGYPNDWENPNGAGNALRSCRQVNSTYSGGCNTSIHPRWNENSTLQGFDVFNFGSLPGGYCYGSSFSGLGYNCYLWSATQSSSVGAWSRRIYSSVNRIDSYKPAGFSVRCLKD